MTERAAFEAWWTAPAAPGEQVFGKQHCWQAWQAAILAERERLRDLLRDIRLGLDWPGPWSDDMRDRIDAAIRKGSTP
jgi:hypothetical protein